MNQIVKTANYALDSSFKFNNNTGTNLIKVGIPNSAVNTVTSLINGLVKGTRIFTLRRNLKNVEVEGAVLAWAEIEYLCNPIPSEDEVLDTFEQIDMLVHRGVGNQPYVVSELSLVDYPETGKVYFRSTDNRTATGDFSEYYPEEGVTFTGVVTKNNLVAEDCIRVITIHTSKETPIVTSYMTVEMVEPRQAPVVQFSPYTNTRHQLDCFAMGNTGAELVEELRSTDLFVDVISFDTISSLLARSVLEQYQVALILNAWRKLYGKLTTSVITSVILDTAYYGEIIAVLESGYAPTKETLNELFSETPAKVTGWNRG